MPEEIVLLAVERQRIIRDLLAREGVVRNAELKQMLHVSAVTVRSDLRELENAGVCEVIWGGAVFRQSAPPPDPTLSLSERTQLNADAKRRIGARAARLVQAGQTIFIDAGSTAVELLVHLPNDLDDLRIVTPALNVAAAAAQLPSVELVMTGGILRPLTRSLIGSQVLRTLDSFNADMAFMGAEGFSVERGVTTSNLLEVEVKQTMIRQAERVVLLADSSKACRVYSLVVTPLASIDVLITDSGLGDSDAEQISALGVEVLRV